MTNTSIVTEFSPFQYLLISIANAFGLDKLLFEERIEWVLKNAKNLRSLVKEAEEPALFMRGIIELDNIRKGTPTGFMMGLDGTASGLQLLGSSSGCVISASQVNLVDPNMRKDVYTNLIQYMNKYLEEDQYIQLANSGEGFSRQDLKEPFMTYFYGSLAKPREIFGEDSDELDAFFNGLEDMAPGAVQLMNRMRAIIDEERLEYNWTLPSGFNVIAKVEAYQDQSIEIDELLNDNGKKSTFTHRFTFNGQDKFYTALMANITHSLDAYVVNEMHLRMKHNKKNLVEVSKRLESVKTPNRINTEAVSIRLASRVLKDDLKDVSDNQLGILKEIVEMTLQFESAPLVTIHDEFKTYPKNIGQMRFHYKEVLAEIADSNLMHKILKSVSEDPNYEYKKLSLDLGNTIRKSRYGLS